MLPSALPTSEPEPRMVVEPYLFNNSISVPEHEQLNLSPTLPPDPKTVLNAVAFVQLLATFQPEQAQAYSRLHPPVAE